MRGESVTLVAIKQTRVMLASAIRDSQVLAYMAANDVEPGDVEDVVAEILEYLERTKEEEKPHG